MVAAAGRSTRGRCGSSSAAGVVARRTWESSQRSFLTSPAMSWAIGDTGCPTSRSTAPKSGSRTSSTGSAAGRCLGRREPTRASTQTYRARYWIQRRRAGVIRQYFQNAVFEYVAAAVQPVRLRLLGDELRNRRYPDGAWRTLTPFARSEPISKAQQIPFPRL